MCVCELLVFVRAVIAFCISCLMCVHSFASLIFCFCLCLLLLVVVILANRPGLWHRGLVTSLCLLLAVLWYY